MKNTYSRRDFLSSSTQTAAAYFLLSTVFQRNAFAKLIEPKMHNWLKGINQICLDLKSHTITPVQWQQSIDELYKRYDLQEIIKFIDLEKLVKGITYPPDMAAVKNVVFPIIEGLPAQLNFGHKVFALQKGRAIVPHVHNNLVSSHLVLKGKFHVRTYDRIFESEDPNKFIYLKPSIDERFGPSQLVTMSDDRDNGHWLIAESETAFTFDVPVSNLNFRESYPSVAGDFNMIFVDPLASEKKNGLLKVPVIQAEAAFSKYG